MSEVVFTLSVHWSSDPTICRRMDGEYSLTAMDGAGDGCVVGSDIERILAILPYKAVS